MEQCRYYFMTRQYKKLFRIDPEIDEITEWYSESDERTQKRIMQRIRESSDPVFLKIIREERRSGRTMGRDEFSDDEMTLWIDLCEKRKQYEQLAQVFHYGTIKYALRAFDILQRSGYQLKDERDRDIYEGLKEKIDRVKQIDNGLPSRIIDSDDRHFKNPFRYLDETEGQIFSDAEIKQMSESYDPAYKSIGLYLASKKKPEETKRKIEEYKDSEHWMLRALHPDFGKEITGINHSDMTAYKEINFDNIPVQHLRADQFGVGLSESEYLKKLIRIIPVHGEPYLEVSEKVKSHIESMNVPDHLNESITALWECVRYLIERNSVLGIVDADMEEAFDFNMFELEEIEED